MIWVALALYALGAGGVGVLTAWMATDDMPRWVMALCVVVWPLIAVAGLLFVVGEWMWPHA